MSLFDRERGKENGERDKKLVKKASVDERISQWAAIRLFFVNEGRMNLRERKDKTQTLAKMRSEGWKILQC